MIPSGFFGGGSKQSGQQQQGSANNGPPGGPPTAQAVPAQQEKKKPSMWEQGLGIAKAFSKEVQKGAKDLATSLKKDFDDIKVQCPSCGAVFKWPKGAEKVARCGACGTLVKAPDSKDKASFHFNSFVDAMGKQVRALSGKPAVENKTTEWHVVVPQGAVSGQQVNVTIKGKLYRTTVPAGLKAGDTFPITIKEPPKIIAAKGKALPITAGSLVQVVPDSKDGGGGVPQGMQKQGSSDVDVLPVVDAILVEDASEEVVLEGDVVSGVVKSPN
mmetsp:Transcript_10734/g.12741  ORF Transcript_10734/g.12741 Transcript_10734/m.12741 type:complete len:272 (+) Transcript_10734:11-826(+)|eukprot:jgi/Bigna1/91103/estExt_fgenesh1_pg.C_880075